MALFNGKGLRSIGFLFFAEEFDFWRFRCRLYDLLKNYPIPQEVKGMADGDSIKWIKSSAEHGNKSAQEVYGKIEKWGFENVKKYLYPKIPFHTWRRHS